MIEGGRTNNIETKSNDNTETKSSAPEKIYQELAKVATKLNDMFFDDDTAEKTNEPSSNGTSELPSKSISELLNRLFSDDLGENPEETGKKNGNEFDIENKDPVLEKIENTLETPEGIKTLIERHPEKAELWKCQLEALDTLNDPDALPAEIRSAQAKLSILKGQLLETAVKDALTDARFDVESQQRVVEGENGGTRPDVIAKNNTDHPIETFGVTIQPGETMSVECKCGGSAYMTNQLNNHIPNQLSGQEGAKILLTTSDIKDAPPGLAKDVCDRYGAKLVIAEVSVADVENAIKEVAES